MMKPVDKMTIQEVEAEITKNLLKDKAVSAKYGLNIGKLWKEMLSSLSKKA